MKQTLFLAGVAVIVLTGLYTVLTLYDSNLNVGRMHQTPVIRPHEEPLHVMDQRTITFHQSETELKEALKNTSRLTPLPASELVLAKGEKDYNAFCSHCHGLNLDGQGAVGQSFAPLPTNLTGEKAAALTDEELFAVISYGTDKTPALASSMSIESRQAVIQYVRFRQKNVR